VYSWVVVHKAFDPVFANDVPYVILTVDLDEGVACGRTPFSARATRCARMPAFARVPYESRSGALLGFELRS
jgi:hypothetical protein